MGTRFGLRVGGVTAALACALLVACGGGGGGGGGGLPATPTPVPTPTLAPASSSTSGPLSTSATTAFSLGGISNGTANTVSAANMTMPQVGVATTGTASMSASVPTGLVAPAARAVQMRAGQTSICSTTCTITSLVYITLSVSTTTTITMSPAFSITIPSNVTVTNGNAYVVVYVNGKWNEVAGPIIATNALTFPSAPVNPSPFTLTAGVNYTFAIITTGTAALGAPTPTPTATPTVAPTATPAIGSAPTLPPVEASNGGYSPYDIALSFNYLVQSGFNGQGETVAIIGDMPPAMSDLTSYISTFSIPSNPIANYSVVNVTVPSPMPDTGGQQEAVLDVETVMGLAPGANIVFYNTQGDLSNQYFLAAEQQVAASNGGNGPDVFSISFGGCEQYPLPGTPPGVAPPDAPVFAGMNAKHTAVTVSSGDEGDNCTTGLTPADSFGVDYPGSDPNVISVGGNETNPATSGLLNPVSWNDHFFSSGQGATGGGVSTTFTIPSFQVGLGGASATYRNTPDIAMPAEGVTLFLSGHLAEFGGTSWSAPEMAAMYAELDEYCGGRPPSNPVGWLYTAYTRSHANYIDVTSGDNHWASEAPTYSAHAGYDNNTGLGMPKAQSLATSVCASRAWAGGLAPMSAQARSYDLYGAQRDTTLPFADRFNRSMDLGDRGANDQTTATLVLRHTPTAASDEQTVIASLKAAGFTIQQTFPNHSLVQVSGTASSINRYFNTSIHQVSQGSYGIRYANATSLTIPAAIAPYVSTVLADTLIARTPKHHRIR